MSNVINVINEEGIECKINTLFRFKIEEYNKEYMAYTLNDDESQDIGIVLIANIEENNGVINLKSIPDEETKMVTLFYDYVRDKLIEKR